MMARISILACLFFAGSCSSVSSGCSGPEWPFYAKAAFKDRPFHLIGSAPLGPRFVRAAGCDFMMIAPRISEPVSAAIDRALEQDRLKYRDTVIGGRFDGEIVHSDRADGPVVVITNIRDLHVLDGKERQDVLDGRYLPPRRQPDRDPSKPIVEY